MTDHDYGAWIGRSEKHEDTVDPWPVAALAATLDLEGVAAETGARLPPLWYWLYCLTAPPRRSLGRDGHAARGGFIPPIPLERRMWAGGRFTFRDDLRIGDAITKTSEIRSIAAKEGRAGKMVFVTVAHTVTTARGIAVEEEQDIVYVEMPKTFSPPAPVPAPPEPLWTDEASIDPVVLFRYSALTFNGHRIHYDQPYARDVEKYPGLVVHGPLQAMLLIGSAERRIGRRAAGFTFRGVRPLFDFEPCRLMGFARPDGGHDVHAVNGEGLVTMQSAVTWRAA